MKGLAGWRAWWGSVRLHTLLLVRAPVALAATILVGVGGALALALAMQLFAPLTPEGRAQTALPLAGYLIYIWVTESLWRVGYTIRQEWLQGSLEMVTLTPAPMFSSLLGRMGVALIPITASSILIGWAIGTLHPVDPAVWGRAALLLFCAACMALGLGVAFAGLTLYLGELASPVGSVVELLLLLLCALFFPFHVLPAPLLALARWIPLAYVADAFRAVLLGIPLELASAADAMYIAIGGALTIPILGAGVYRAVLLDLKS